VWHDGRVTHDPEPQPAPDAPHDPATVPDAAGDAPDRVGSNRAEGPFTAESPLDPLDERESAYGLLQRADELTRGRHHAQAAVLLERAHRLEPGRGSIVEAMARARYNSAQHQLALESFEELLVIDPSSHYGHYGLGQSLKLLGRPDAARTHLRLACALAPQSTLYRAALARLP